MMNRVLFLVILSLLHGLGCQLIDNQIRGSVAREAPAVEPILPISNELEFTGNSSAAAPLTDRIFDEISTPSWPLSGNCDATLGDVTVYGPGVNQTFNTICNLDGTFLTNVNYGHALATSPFFMEDPFVSGYSGAKIVKIRQASMRGQTTLFQSTAAFPPEIITNATELQNMSLQNINALYILGNNINFLQEVGPTNNWTPLGTVGNEFQGKFDGDGHTITRLHITGGVVSAGLFGAIESASITNLNIKNIYINSPGAPSIGGLVGNITSNAFIYNVQVTGSVIGGTSLGGLVGTMATAKVKYSSFNGVVKGTNANIGGLVGDIADTQSSFDHCYTSVDVMAPTADFVGGMVGKYLTNSASNTSDNSVTGSVEGNNKVGGFAGQSQAILKHNFVVAAVIVNGTEGGRFIGSDNGNQYASNFVASDPVCTGCDNSVGDEKTVAELNIESTYSLFDFVGESVNGIENLWKMPASGGPPILVEFNDIPRSSYCWANARFSNMTYANSGEAGVDGLLETSAFTICTASQLKMLATTSADYDKNFAIEDHLNLALYAGSDLPPIGDGTPFTGNFDGQDYTLSDYAASSQSSWRGLFGRTFNGTLKNIHLKNVNIEIGEASGALVGQLNFGVVDSCSVQGTIKGIGTASPTYIGGLIGQNNISTVKNSFSHISMTNNLTFHQAVGGLVGANTSGGKVENCYSTGTLTIFGSTVGGLVGQNDSVSDSVKNSYSLTSVTAEGFVGGLVGLNRGTIFNSFTSAPVIGNQDGGNAVSLFLGDQTGSENDSYYDSSKNCNNLGTGSCNTSWGFPIDLGSTPNYFYFNTNPPLSLWDFDTIWQEVPGDYPTLQ